VTTLSLHSLLLNHRNSPPSAICTRCGIEDESFLHRVRDFTFSKNIWHLLGFFDPDFFSTMEVSDWLKDGSTRSNSFIFAACLWWAWRHGNQMCFNNETWSLHRLSYNIHNMVENFKICFTPNSNGVQIDKFIKWICDNHSCFILNVDGSCLDLSVRARFGGIIRTSVGFYLSGFSGYIQGSSDILLAELYAIYQGLSLARSLNIEEIICYSDSLLSINLIKGLTLRFHIYAVLIQDMKDLIQFVTLLEREITVRTLWPNLELQKFLIFLSMSHLRKICCTF